MIQQQQQRIKAATDALRLDSKEGEEHKGRPVSAKPEHYDAGFGLLVSDNG